MGEIRGNIELDYPTVLARGRKIYILGIYPKYHTRLFPDSILRTESADLIRDVSSSNSIHKIYICNMRGVESLQKGDVIVIYRTAEGGSAEYTAVATSICVVEEQRSIYSFSSEQDFLDYSSSFSVFSEAELRQIWRSKRYPKIIRFTYNANLLKRPNRKTLINEVGIDRDAYAGFMQITPEQLEKIADIGKLNEGIIVY